MTDPKAAASDESQPSKQELSKQESGVDIDMTGRFNEELDWLNKVNTAERICVESELGEFDGDSYDFFRGLHKLCCVPRKGKDDPKWEEVRNFFRLDSAVLSDAAKVTAILSTESLDGQTPLHFACMHDPPFDTIETIIKKAPDVVSIRNKKEATALHTACSSGNVSTKVLRYLIEMTVKMQDTSLLVNDRRHIDPFECAIRSNGAQAASIRETLLDYTIQHMKERRHGLPDESHNKSFKEEDDSPKAQAQVISQCRLHFMKLVQKGIEDHEQDQKIANPIKKGTIQHTLNYISLSKATIFLFMFDLYVQVMIVLAVTFASAGRASHRDDLVVDNWELVILSFLLVWMFIREFIQFISTNLKEWATDFWNWVDVAQIILICISMSIYQGTDHLTMSERALITFSSGIVYFAALKILKNFFFGIAVFVHAMELILIELIPFLVTTGIIIASFAQMYHVGNKGANFCRDEEKDSNIKNYCKSSFNYGLIYSDLYAQLFGGAEVEINENPISTALSYSFGFVIGLLFLNVLIAKISNVFTDVESKGKLVFYQNRLETLVEIESTISFLEQIPYSVHFAQFIFSCFEIGAEILSVEFLQSLYEPFDFNENIFKIFYYLVLRVSLPLIIIVQFLLGLLTFGLMWPEWMKEYMFLGEACDDLDIEEKVDLIQRETENLQLRLKDGFDFQVNVNKEIAALRSDMTKMLELLENK